MEKNKTYLLSKYLKYFFLINKNKKPIAVIDKKKSEINEPNELPMGIRKIRIGAILLNEIKLRFMFFINILCLIISIYFYKFIFFYALWNFSVIKFI